MLKPLTAVVVVGMGWLLAYTPSVWKLVAYLVPAISICLLVVCVRKLLRMMGEG
jgi:uncharacterized membrane protein